MNTKVSSIISVRAVLNVNTDVMLENANTRKIYAVSPAIYYKDKTLTVYYAGSYYEIPKAIYINRLSAKGTDEVMKRRGAIA